MITLDKCEIEAVLKRKFKGITPVIEPWFDTVLINANAVSTQNNTYTWRFQGDEILNGVITANKSNPFFVGQLEMNIFNDDPVGVSLANSFAVISKNNITSIDTFYLSDTDTLIRFGVGTFNGLPFPASGINLDFNTKNSPQFVLGNYVQLQVFTDGTGAIFLQAVFTFKGYRVYLQ